MSLNKIINWLTGPVLALGVILIAPARVLAHCDGLDGPVVKAAQQALETRNPAFALSWVQEKDEPEIRTAFERTLAVRTLSPQAKELADRFFFETLVRVHRAGEGAPFTGLKPAGRDLGPAIPAAERPSRKTPWNQLRSCSLRPCRITCASTSTGSSAAKPSCQTM